MATKKIITVFGATGKQGGSVAQTFLNDPKLKDAWAVRGVSRDISKDGSKKLAAQGADMVSADLNDQASLAKAMTGAYAVFAVTNYWETLDDKLEIQQGKNLADAAKVSAPSPPDPTVVADEGSGSGCAVVHLEFAVQCH